MSKMIVFGDSFVHESGEPYSWIRQVSDYYGNGYVNIAEPGSSMQHGILQLTNYLTNGPYKETDLFIYQITGCRRSPWAIPPASAGISRYFAGTLPKDHPTYKYYAENEDFYARYLELYRSDIEEFYQIQILSLLHSLCNKTLVFIGWPLLATAPDKTHNAIQRSFGHLFEPTENTIFIKQPLYNLSMQEMTIDEKTFIKNIGWTDPRANHFSEVNHHILAEQTIASLESGRDCIDASAFKTDFFTPPHS